MHDTNELPAILGRWCTGALAVLAVSHAIAAGIPPVQIAADSQPITVVDGDDIAFSRVENAEGFSQSRVGQITQDDKGFMWFGTQYGLIRFDGYGYTAFAPDARTQNQLSGVFVHAILKDRSGRLWVASDQGLDILDPQSGALRHIAYADAARVSAVQSIYEDRNGTIWLCTTAGLYGLDSSGRTRAHFRHDAADPGSLSSSDVKFAGEDRSGTFWITTSAGLDAIDRTDGRVMVRVPLRESRELSFIEDRRGTFWIYHAGGTGLATFDRSTNILTKHTLIDSAGRTVPPSGIYAALEDRDGGLWFGTSTGLLRHDAERRRFIRYRNSPGDPQSLSDDDVVTLFQDRQNNIWVALHGMPLNLFPGRMPSFRKLPSRPGAARGRAGKMVNSVFEVNGQSLWISFVGMLLRVDLKTGDRENLSERLRLTTDVISMAQDAHGRLWLGTVGTGLVGVDPSGGISRHPHDPADPGSIANDVVNDILVDHAQNLWLATWGGLSRFDERRGRFETFKPPGSNPKYLALAEDRAHKLWLATHLDGLQRFDPVTGEFTSYPATGAEGSISNGRVNAVHIDQRGIVWAGTQNGLDALDPATGLIRNYRSDDGLPGNAVSCILEDEQGGIWLGTNNGIARLDARTGEFRSFSRADGLPGVDFTGWGSCHRSEAGEFFFAGFAGATAFNPQQVRVQSQAPPVEFTDLVIAGKLYPQGLARSAPSGLPQLQGLTLPYSQNAVAAGFAALSYTNPMSNRYRFRLAGLEEQWHSVGADRRIASYNSLPPGSYRLEVQGATSGGPWSDARTLDLTILEPWWQTSLFRASVGVLVLGLAWLAYRVRVRQVMHQFEIRLDERVAERTRIARELHDSLLQGFHGLMFRLQAVRNLLPMRPQDAARALDEALTRGDVTVEQARAAVTDLRTFGSGEPDLQAALHAMADDTPMLSQADAPEYRITVEGVPRPMIPLVRDDVLQVAREAFRNAVMHARARLVQIEVTWGEERFSLRVRDDGVGLESKLIAQGREGHWGLHGMRERTRVVGGNLEILSEGASGTSVELSIPAARAYAKIAHS